MQAVSGWEKKDHHREKFQTRSTHAWREKRGRWPIVQIISEEGKGKGKKGTDADIDAFHEGRGKKGDRFEDSCCGPRKGEKPARKTTP